MQRLPLLDCKTFDVILFFECLRKPLRWKEKDTSGKRNCHQIKECIGYWRQQHFILGDFGTILYYDSTEWIEQESGYNHLLLGVWEDGSDRIDAADSSQRGGYDRL